MLTQDLRISTYQNPNVLADVSKDHRGGFPIVAVLTFVMVVVMLFALGYLLFNDPVVVRNLK